MRAGEAIKIEYEYPVNKPDQVRVTKLRPAGKWLHLMNPRTGTLQIKPDVFGLGKGREWAYLW